MAINLNEKNVKQIDEGSTTQSAPTLTVGGNSSNFTVTPNFSSGGNSVSFQVITNAANGWTVSNVSSSNWILFNASGNSGNFLIITCQANTSFNQRSGGILVLAGGRSLLINVVQNGADTLTVDTAEWIPGTGASNLTVHVTSNVSWSAGSNRSWMFITSPSGLNNGSFTINIDPTNSFRDGIVTISGGGITRQIRVDQAKVELLTNAQVNNLNASPGSRVLTDLRTMRSFNIYWQPPGGSHTDWSPMTSADTAAIQNIVNSDLPINHQNWNNMSTWPAFNNGRPGVLNLNGRLIAVGYHFRPHGSIVGGTPGFPLTSQSNNPPYDNVGGHMCMYYSNSTGNTVPATPGLNEAAERARARGLQRIDN
jgi:hypothetical protein